jgi:hypothetical protein
MYLSGPFRKKKYNQLKKSSLIKAIRYSKLKMLNLDKINNGRPFYLFQHATNSQIIIVIM